MIPSNITSEHIIKAIEHVRKKGVPERREPTKYALVYKEKHYPPKYTISLANHYANGEELQPSEFSGGDESNKFLRKLGFLVVNELEDTAPLDQKAIIEKFHKDMVEIYNKAKSECRYNASLFINHVSKYGGYKAAKGFINSSDETYGFIKLWEFGRLDLTVETHILFPHYKELFTIEERRIAYERLKKYDYEVQGVIFEDVVDFQVIQEDILVKLIYLLIKAIFYPINFLIRCIVGLVSKTNEKLEEKFGE